MCLKANGHLLQMYYIERVYQRWYSGRCRCREPAAGIVTVCSEGQSYSIQYTHSSVPRCPPPRTHPLVPTPDLRPVTVRTSNLRGSISERMEVKWKKMFTFWFHFRYGLELEINLRKVWSFTITEKAPTNDHLDTLYFLEVFFLKHRYPGPYYDLSLMIFVLVTQFHICLPWVIARFCIAS